MPRNFDELRSKMSPQAQARSKAKAAAMLEKMALHELRKERRMTQAALATAMQVGQGAISKIEQRGTTNIATLDNYVRSLGGRLEMRAVFPEKTVALTVSAADEPSRAA